jgi:hypothetical protein
MFKHNIRVIALACIAASLVSMSSAQKASKVHQLKGSISGYLAADSVSFYGEGGGAGITGIGLCSMNFAMFFGAAGQPVSGDVLFEKEGGTALSEFIAVLDVTSVVDTGSGFLYIGTGELRGGTGKFEGATGTFSWMAQQDGYFDGSQRPTVFTFDGSIVY